MHFTLSEWKEERMKYTQCTLHCFLVLFHRWHVPSINTKYRWSCSICRSVAHVFNCDCLVAWKAVSCDPSLLVTFFSFSLASNSLNLFTSQYFIRTSCCEWNYFLFSLSFTCYLCCLHRWDACTSCIRLHLKPAHMPTQAHLAAEQMTCIDKEAEAIETIDIEK